MAVLLSVDFGLVHVFVTVPFNCLRKKDQNYVCFGFLVGKCMYPLRTTSGASSSAPGSVGLLVKRDSRSFNSLVTLQTIEMKLPVVTFSMDNCFEHHVMFCAPASFSYPKIFNWHAGHQCWRIENASESRSRMQIIMGWMFCLETSCAN